MIFFKSGMDQMIFNFTHRNFFSFLKVTFACNDSELIHYF